MDESWPHLMKRRTKGRRLHAVSRKYPARCGPRPAPHEPKVGEIPSSRCYRRRRCEHRERLRTRSGGEDAPCVRLALLDGYEWKWRAENFLAEEERMIRACGSGIRPDGSGGILPPVPTCPLANHPEQGHRAGMPLPVHPFGAGLIVASRLIRFPRPRGKSGAGSPTRPGR